jgi:glucosamine-6-phosphate deaminase
MEIIIVRDADEVGRVAALKIASVVQRKPEAVLGLATGSSPTGIYASLAARVAAGELDFGRASGFALDEYVGLPLDHRRVALGVVPLGMDASKVRVPDGRASDIEAAVVDYEQAIADAGGIDIQILGIGANGHIGFNEPTSSFASRTRIKTLAPQTRADNARFFDDPSQVPTHCLTQGLGTILDAHEVVLVAQGSAKASAVAGMVEGPIGAMCPGSALQLHRHATIVVDEAAAADLQLADYYRYTYANKPVWQRFE